MALVIATAAAGFAKLRVQAARIFASFSSWRQARRDYQALCELEDAALRDMGLSRGDLRDASAVDFFDDPTAVLAARALERRGRRQVAVPDRAAGPPSAAGHRRVEPIGDMRCGAT